MTKVLACIDGSGYGASVCDHAAWAATGLGAEIELLHVLDRAPDAIPADLSGSIGLGAHDHLLEDLASLDERRSRLRMDRGRVMLAEAEKRIRELGVTDVSSRLRHGRLVDAVVDLEDETRLVVLGKRGEHADFTRLHLGGSVEQVVRASSKPVLVASRAFKPIKRLAIAFDGGPSSRRAVEFLCSDPAFARYECDIVMAGPERAEREAHLDWARRELATLGGAHNIVQRPGAAENVIADYVRDEAIDLLVMGAYGHSPIRQFVVGSTTAAVMRTCPIPVLLFR
ncbi:MAG: universal stress protein [Caulobacter sp.]|nr:universal stress protein [Caulobacter sp.]